MGEASGVLNKDTAVWFDDARPINTCIEPSTLENMPAQLCSISSPKSMFGSIKN